MKVNVYSVDQTTGEETLVGDPVEIAELFPAPDDAGYGEAYRELSEFGRVWIGGGAAQLFLLTRAA